MLVREESSDFSGKGKLPGEFSGRDRVLDRAESCELPGRGRGSRPAETEEVLERRREFPWRGIGMSLADSGPRVL